MITITKEFSTELRETVEDAVEYVISEAVKRGELVSGETAWNVIECLAVAKVAQFEGKVA